MPNFFSKYPKIDYTFADGSVHKLTDINVKYSLSSLVKTSSDVFYPFAYRDQDRPDILADKYYDSSDYYWLFFMSNDVFDTNHDLPMSMDVFNLYLIHKYKLDAIANGYTENPSDILGYCFDIIHHYEDSEGHVIDHDTFMSVGNTRSLSIFDYEFSVNEKKRAVKFLESSRKTLIKNELESNLRKLRADSEQ